MSDPYWNDDDPEEHVLHPIFGTYCRSQSFSYTAEGSRAVHMHYEIYLENPVQKTWAINKVMTPASMPPDQSKGKPRVKSITLHKGMDFLTALTMLGELERECTRNPLAFKPLYPDPPLMGWAHYKAFAEREGYIFDKSGLPHAKPHPSTLPSGFVFMEDDIQSAAGNMQRPVDAFTNEGSVNKIPNTLFIFDAFNRAAGNDAAPDVLAQGRILSLLDRFSSSIDTAYQKMKEYCEKYHELGQGSLITEAENALLVAEASVSQLKAYGVEASEFEKFVSQCQIICHVLHAQGLYDLIRQGKGDFDLNEAAFKSRVTSAVAAYREIDPSEKGIQMLHDLITHASHLEPPKTIDLYLTNYKYQREEFSRNRPPKKPSP